MPFLSMVKIKSTILDYHGDQTSFIKIISSVDKLNITLSILTIPLYRFSNKEDNKMVNGILLKRSYILLLVEYIHVLNTSLDADN